MADDVDEPKNILNDFKILVAKVNDDNKNKKKKLDEMKEWLEICKKGYQKLHSEHENLRKKYDNLVTQYNRTKKSKLIWKEKRKIVIETESEKLDEKNEEEEQTEEESEVDEVIPQKKEKNTHQIKKDIKKIKQKSN